MKEEIKQDSSLISGLKNIWLDTNCSSRGMEAAGAAAGHPGAATAGVSGVVAAAETRAATAGIVASHDLSPSRMARRGRQSPSSKSFNVAVGYWQTASPLPSPSSSSALPSHSSSAAASESTSAAVSFGGMLSILQEIYIDQHLRCSISY